MFQFLVVVTINAKGKRTAGIYVLVSCSCYFIDYNNPIWTKCFSFLQLLHLLMSYRFMTVMFQFLVVVTRDIVEYYNELKGFSFLQLLREFFTGFGYRFNVLVSCSCYRNICEEYGDTRLVLVSCSCYDSAGYATKSLNQFQFLVVVTLFAKNRKW